MIRLRTVLWWRWSSSRSSSSSSSSLRSCFHRCACLFLFFLSLIIGRCSPSACPLRHVCLHIDWFQRSGFLLSLTSHHFKSATGFGWIWSKVSVPASWGDKGVPRTNALLTAWIPSVD